MKKLYLLLPALFSIINIGLIIYNYVNRPTPVIENAVYLNPDPWYETKAYNVVMNFDGLPEILVQNVSGKMVTDYPYRIIVDHATKVIIFQEYKNKGFVTIGCYKNITPKFQLTDLTLQ